MNGPRRLALLVAAAATLIGCRRDMIDQPKQKPLGASDFFPDGAASRPFPAHTLARGQLHSDTHFYTGRVRGELVATLPSAVTAAQLARGRERYEIFCSVCHGDLGDGQGMIVQRGFPNPPSFHIDRLRTAPVGHFYEVISNGFGLMYSYGSRVAPEDRWAIVAYIRALQLSQNATLADAEPAARAQLETSRQ